MGHLVHLLSEHRPLAGPYHISVPDFFGVRLVRTKERNAEIRQELINKLMNEWDDMGYEEASLIFKEDYPNWHKAARFHLCMVSYLLTTEGALNLAGQALIEVKRTLPPGGTIVVMGGLDEDYARIHARLRRKLRGLHRLDIELPFSLTLTDAQQGLIKPGHRSACPQSCGKGRGRRGIAK